MNKKVAALLAIGCFMLLTFVNIRPTEKERYPFNSAVKWKDFEFEKPNDKLPQLRCQTKNNRTMDTFNGSTIKLPQSLHIIEDEAFRGTAIVTVDIPEAVEYIGHYAFADVPSLKKIELSETTRRIEINAFSGSNQLTISGTFRSYARSFAAINGIPFSPIAMICAGDYSTNISMYEREKRSQIVSAVVETAEWMIEHAQCNSFIVRKFDQYGDYYAKCISGRSPPTSM